MHATRNSLMLLLVASSLHIGCSSSLDVDVDASPSSDGAIDSSVPDASDASVPDVTPNPVDAPVADALTDTPPDANCSAPIVSFNANEKHMGSYTDGSGIFAFLMTLLDQDRAVGSIQFMSATTSVPDPQSSSDLYAAVYDDANGQPGKLLTSTLWVKLDEKLDWRDLKFKTPWLAKASTPYWIVFGPATISRSIYLSEAQAGTQSTTYWSYSGFGKWPDAGPIQKAWMMRLTGCQ